MTIKPRPFDYDSRHCAETDCVLAKVGDTYLVLRPAIEGLGTSIQELYAVYADTNDIEEARRILRKMNGVDLEPI